MAKFEIPIVVDWDDIKEHIKEYLPRWIPVTERLPGKSGRYLVEFYRFAFSPQVMRYDSVNNKWFYDGCKSIDMELPTIAAWMPLPKHYSGGDER